MPKIKENNIKELGAEINKVTHAEWKRILKNGKVKNQSSSKKFVHVCANYDVMAGKGVIGLEIVDQLEEISIQLFVHGVVVRTRLELLLR